MRLGRLVPIVVSVLVVSAGLPFVARGEAPAQRGPTATPTRVRGLPNVSPPTPGPWGTIALPDLRGPSESIHTSRTRVQ